MGLEALNSDTKIGVVGLGYVGLPLAHAIANHFPTVGYDINAQRVADIRNGIDRNLTVSKDDLQKSPKPVYSDDPKSLTDCDIYIVTAPTPVNEQKQPDLGPLKSATKLVASYLKPGNIVVFESTVYPGATEEECVPILEEISGLSYNKDFFAGYSPERVSPGDTAHSLLDIIKVTSGSSDEAADKIDALYSKVITAGTHRANSIKVAEAAKVIENTQRDVNIALINELAILFEKLNIDTQEVLKAAGSKWNFLPFSPGLVGGHCISVDPYYLTHKAQQVGHHPEVILAGRRINDSMGSYVAERVVRLMLSKRIQVNDGKILILGRTFKENCPDTRNSKVVDIISTLHSYHAQVEVYDPWVDRSDSELMIDAPKKDTYDAVIIAVSHTQFIDMGIESIRALGKSNSVVFDVKHLFPSNSVDGSL